MKRNEAVSYLKDVLSTNELVSPEAITLEEPKGDTGFKVHIKGVSYQQTVKEVAQKRKLAVKEQKDELVVFKP